MDYIIKLGSSLLKETNQTLKKKLNNLNFYESYQYLREQYQKKYPYRIGICDGAHRITAMFNVIYGIELKSNGLSSIQEYPDVKNLYKVEARAQCEVWAYTNLSESIKIKQRLKQNNILYLLTLLQNFLIVPHYIGYMMYQNVDNINQKHV